jgi:catechol 2,3-dioxygenase-like lactoylglutathione lyase family enzyme
MRALGEPGSHRGKGQVWLGVPAGAYAAAVRFFCETLGLEVAFDAGNTVELTAGNGDRIQPFGPGHHYFEFYRSHGASTVPCSRWTTWIRRAPSLPAAAPSCGFHDLLASDGPGPSEVGPGGGPGPSQSGSPARSPGRLIPLTRSGSRLPRLGLRTGWFCLAGVELERLPVRDCATARRHCPTTGRSRLQRRPVGSACCGIPRIGDTTVSARWKAEFRKPGAISRRGRGRCARGQVRAAVNRGSNN